MVENESSENFVLRFKLADLPSPPPEGDPLVVMIGQFLSDIQNIGCLCIGKQRVHVDGFVLANDPDTVHSVPPRDLMPENSGTE